MSKTDWGCIGFVSQLMFLVNARLDIQFAVHQCEKFNHNHKQSHCNTVKKIVCCLKETQGEGRERGLMFGV